MPQDLLPSQKEQPLREALNSDAFANVWNALFKFTDAAFKLISWAIIVALLRAFLKHFPHSWWFTVLYFIMNGLFAIILIFTALHLLSMRTPAFADHTGYRTLFKVFTFALSIALLALTTSPRFEMDAFIDMLAAQRPVGTSQDTSAARQ